MNALKEVFPGDENLAPVALRWILQFDSVSTIIPGASRPAQVGSNLKAAELPPLTAEQAKAVDEIYAKYIKPSVHQRW